MYTTLEKIGLVCITIVGFQLTKFFLKTLYMHFLAIRLGINAVDFKELGRWAVITGATDGIGKAYAQSLARKGLNVFLISRTQSKLDEVAEELGEKYKVETKTLAVDFSEGENIYNLIDKNLCNLEIGVLINNVGISYSYPEYFLNIENKEELFRNVINCNILSTINMCKIILPGMVERKKGVIVNVSSMSAIIPQPLMTVYAASKAFVEKFTEDLRTEYSKSGIEIQCLLPGYVATKMSKIRSSTWMAPSASTYVSEAMKTIGVHKHTTGYFPHTLMLGVISTLNSISPQLNAWFIMRTLENIRKRALSHKTRP